jgi:polyisoprenyl-phosphate glycosyltransferase
LSIVLAIAQICVRIFFPTLTPPSVTTTLLVIMFFGSINLFAASLIGEYLAKIFEEVKHRPLYIRRSFIQNGELRPASERPASSP